MLKSGKIDPSMLSGDDSTGAKLNKGTINSGNYVKINDPIIIPIIIS